VGSAGLDTWALANAVAQANAITANHLAIPFKFMALIYHTGLFEKRSRAHR
jgi:hypothetical protein